MRCIPMSFSTLSPAITSLPPARHQYFHCPSAKEAIEDIIEKEAPSLIAFGETHPDTRERLAVMPMTVFVTEILPSLQTNGFTGGVVEGLFSDQNATKALISYFSSPLVPSVALTTAFYTPNANYLSALRTLIGSIPRDKGNVLVGGSLQSDDVEMGYLDDPLFGLNIGGKLAAVMRKTAQRTAEQVIELQKTHKRVYSYGGGQHNDKVRKTAKEGISIWEHSIPIDLYVEVDLLSPEAMQHGPHEGFAYPEYSFWLDYAIPRSGVTLVARGNGSYSILYPAGKLYIPAPTESTPAQPRLSP